MNYTFKNGSKVEGTLPQILAIAKTLGETLDLGKLPKDKIRGYYNSSSKGLVEIKNMPTPHIKSALLKISKDYFENLSKTKGISNKEFCDRFIRLGDNTTVEDLFQELSSRI